MKTKTLLLTLAAIFFLNTLSFADSPLTSTPFSNAYKDIDIVVKASESDGLLNKELMDYMINKKNPVDIKMAIINELNWDIDGKSNAVIFTDYLKKKKIYKTESQFLAKAHCDIILSMAYITALDDYNDVTDAVRIADAALKKNSESYTYNIITALIKSQKAFDSDWCDVFKLTDRVRKDESLKNDIRDRAKNIIFEYMDLYEEYCK